MPDKVQYLQVQWKVKVTKALIKFCEDHRYPSGGLRALHDCLAALDQGDLKSAVEYYRKVPLGRTMGCFDDWFPPAEFPHETPEYIQVVFQALLNEWDRVMKLSLNEL
jgi:hypothetical protein